MQRKEHSLDSSQLSVRLYHPLLEGKKEAKKKGGRKSIRKEVQTEHVTQYVKKDIPQEKLHLLKISGFCEKLDREKEHLSISLNIANSSLTLEGPRVELQEAKTELWEFLTKAKEQVLELSERLLRVLLSRNGSHFLQESLRKQDIVAILVPGQRKTANEAKIVGLTSVDTRNAERVIRSAVKEFSLSLTDANAQVIKDRKWKEFVSLMMSHYVVEVEIVSNTLWVSGVSQDVAKCFKEVKDFLNENTILRDLISTPEGCTRFLFKEWKEKVEEIKRKYSTECRATLGNEGIEISGTAENLTKCAEEIQKLILRVNSDTLDIDKPGMGKFFSQSQGTRLLRVVEDDHHCVIVPKRSADVDEAPFSEGGAIEDERNNAMCICSYTTPEGKKISVYKDDLTKHRVDAIVNAANERLEHIGGLAGAIVKAGGKEIQEECRAFVRERGNLLEGQTYVSKPGMLPCKHIIHAVGPQWDNKAKREREEGKKTRQEGMLEYAISNCLKDAKSLSSIAIPAVSSGLFGFPVDLCAEVIVGTAFQFFKNNPTCKLSEIHLTNHDATVAKFAKEMCKRFGQEQTFYERDKPVGLNTRRDTSSVPAKKGNSLHQQNSLTTTEGVKISVRSGDLTKEQVS